MEYSLILLAQGEVITSLFTLRQQFTVSFYQTFKPRVRFTTKNFSPS